MKLAAAYRALTQEHGDNLVRLFEKEQEVLKLRAEITALQEERNHLLGVIDEYQEKLRFEGETA